MPSEVNTPLTNIVITCWNALDYTRTTVESLFKTTHTNYTLTFVDNGSAIDTKKYLAGLKVPKYCKQLKIITNDKNMGPGHAANQGFNVSMELGAEFTCLCNNDLYFQNGWLEKLEAAALTRKDIAMVGPLRPSTSVMYDDKTTTADKLKSIKDYDGWREELEMYTDYHVDQFEDFAHSIIGVNGGGLHFVSCPPDALSSCCLLIRNSIFAAEFGYVADPRFIHYGSEDSDMSWAAAVRGYRCAILKDVYVHHFRGKSLSDNKLDRASLIVNSNRIFFEKWRATIHDFVCDELAKGVNVSKHLEIDRGDKYWFLQRLNRDIQFWVNGALDESKFKDDHRQSGV